MTRAPAVIDLRRVIGQKSKLLLRLMPRPLLRYLERVIHVKDLNRVIAELATVEGVEFARGGLEHMGATVVARYAERLDGVKRPIVAANHPLGGLDGLALISAVAERHADVVLPANDLLMHLEGLSPVLVPVNKHGTNRENRERFEDAFAGDRTVIHFPAGLCSRKKGTIVRDLVWQKSFIVRAIRYRRPIVPTYVDGHNSDFFYNLARLRRLSRLGFNLEMLYLVDEMYKQRGKTITITFGRPIDVAVFDRSRTTWEWAHAVRRHVYRLAIDPAAEFEAAHA